jgi:hypothetical protein
MVEMALFCKSKKIVRVIWLPSIPYKCFKNDFIREGFFENYFVV